MSYEINKIIFLIFSLTFCQHSYSKCIPISFESDNSVYKRISYYSLQGDTKKVEKELNNLLNEYDKDYAIGYSYLIGRNNLKNYDLAEKYLKNSARYCFSPAHYSLGYLYYIKELTEESKKWLFSAKNLGDNLAAHQLGLIYKNENNSKEMLENLKFADTNNFVPSVTELGVQFYDGILVDKNLYQAFKYFEKAAFKNDPLAQNNLGWMYEHGEGVSKDITKAEKWYRISTENGFELATENLKRLDIEIKSNKTHMDQ